MTTVDQHLVVATKHWENVGKFILPTDRRIEYLTTFCLETINQEENPHCFLSVLNQENLGFNSLVKTACLNLD
ncbi:MAG: hypothetical protein AB3A66_04400 [Nodularia sp. CChRGM 3473]